MAKKRSSSEKALLKRFGNRVRKVRREKGMSQEELALESNLDRSYIGGVERGERNISIINLKKIADALHVDPISLLYNV